jgi:hypothetical protein
MKQRLTEDQLAQVWGISPRTLQDWRTKGLGPAYIRIGRNTVLYRQEDVEAYEASKLQGELPDAWRASMKRAASVIDMAACWKVGAEKQGVLHAVRDELRAHLGGA